MCRIINLERYRRVRRATHDKPGAARHHPRGGGRGLVSIGVVSEELLARLTEKD